MKHLPIIWLVFCAVIAGLIMGIGDNNAWPAEEITAYKANDGMLFESKEKAEAYDFKDDLKSTLSINFCGTAWWHRVDCKTAEINFISDNAHKIYRILKPFCEEKK